MSSQARVVKYHTHRGVYTCILKEGNKYASFVTVDSFPLALKRIRLGDSEFKYIDEYPDMPLVKAVKTMMFVGNVRGINNNALAFLKDILSELKADVTVIKQEDMK